MEHTATFETKLQEAVVFGAAVDEQIRASLRTVDQAQDAYEEEFRRLESDDRREAASIKYVEALAARWLLQKDVHFDETNAELAFIGDQMLQDAGQLAQDDFVAEAMVGRKVHRGVLYYKVAWKGRNLATWEREDSIDNKKLIQEFERWFLSRAMMPKSSQRLRPAVYISRRLRAMSPELRARIDAVRATKGGIVTWSCEVEPYIWIPYDEEDQYHIEGTFAAGQAKVTIHMNNIGYELNFEDMLQRRSDNNAGGGRGRSIRRFVAMNPEVEGQLLAAMSDEELRNYIASVPEILPVHFEALQRLHEADKVQHVVSVEELQLSLRVETFEEIMNHVLEGQSYPCFSSECFVCLEDYVGTDAIAHLVCGHFFHKKCAFEYFQRYSRLCPICKEDVL